MVWNIFYFSNFHIFQRGRYRPTSHYLYHYRIIVPIDSYFSRWLKPPTRLSLPRVWLLWLQSWVTTNWVSLVIIISGRRDYWSGGLQIFLLFFEAWMVETTHIVGIIKPPARWFFVFFNFLQTLVRRGWSRLPLLIDVVAWRRARNLRGFCCGSRNWTG